MGAGIRLKELLRQRQVTIKQLSIMTGVSINTLYSITKRDSSSIDSAILSRIVTALGITEEEFYNFRLQPLAALEGTASFLRKVLVPYSDIDDFDGEIDEKFEGLRISLNDRGYSFTKTELALIHAFAQLNDEGKQKAIERVEELAEIPKYQKENPPQE